MTAQARIALALCSVLLAACSVAPLPLPTPTAAPTAQRSPVPTVTPLPPPTNTPEPSATPEPSPTGPPPTPTADNLTEPGGGEVVFEDLFNSVGIWGVDDTDAYKIEVAGGAMNLTVKQPDRWTLTIAGRQMANFYAEVTAVADNCSGEDSYGLLYRFVDANNFYYFGLGCGARYRVRHYQEGAWHELVDWTEASAIVTGAEAENRLAVRAVGNQFYFFANETYLGQATDAAFAQGQFGLFAHDASAGGLTAKFDDLQVRAATP